MTLIRDMMPAGAQLCCALIPQPDPTVYVSLAAGDLRPD